MKKIAGKMIAGVLSLMIGAISILPQSTFAQSPNQTRTFGDNRGQEVAAGIQGVGDQTTPLLDVVRNVINFALGLLSFIALVVLLYGGFQMITAAGDDGKYQTGFKVLKQAAIGIAFVGLAWIFITFVFYFLSAITGG